MTGEEIGAALDESGAVGRAGGGRRRRSRASSRSQRHTHLYPTCQNKVGEKSRRIRVVTFIRDHICPSERYRLNEKDLAFGELLREKPGWMQQDEYNERDERGWIRARTALAVRTIG